MGFMVRVILGVFLVLSARHLAECAPSALQRHVRQLAEEDAAPEVPIIEDEPSRINQSDAKEDFYTNSVINHTSLTNSTVQNSKTSLLDEKPKTESNKQFNNVEYSEDNKRTESDVTVHYFENVSVAPVLIAEGTPVSSTEKVREEGGRSLDFTKYVSPEFHDRNNVYSFPISSDTEKYTNLHNDISFTSTPSYDFDKKQRDIETDVKDKLKYIDREFEQAERNFSDGTDLSNTKIINVPKENDTSSELRYTKSRNITSHFYKIKNKINKETDVETGESIDHTSSFNKTTYFDEPPKDYKNKISSGVGLQLAHKVTTETTIAKSIDSTNDKVKESTNQRDGAFLTKPPLPNRTVNSNHLLSNKIENEVLTSDSVSKPKSDFPYFTTDRPTATATRTTTVSGTEPYRYENSRKENGISIAKRGSTKYADTITSAVPTSTTTAKPSIKENGTSSLQRNGTAEEVVQENHIYPVQVPAPTTITTTEMLQYSQTEMEDSLSNTTYLDTTEMTQEIYNATTSTVVTTTMATTEMLQTTTESPRFATEVDIESYFESTTDENPETSTASTTEYTFMTYTDILPNTSPRTTAELDRVSSGRGFNFSSTGFEYQTSQDKSDNTTDTPNMTTQTPISNITTEEIVPTTTDYRDNIIVKHPETTTAKHSNFQPRTNVSSDSSAEETETYKEITKKSADSQITTQRYLIRTHSSEPTSESTPFIIPLNISMYEFDSAESTTVNMGMEEPEESNGGKIAAIVISAIGAVCLVLLAGLLFVMRKRHKRFNYGQRCTPVSLDAYSVDNVSVYNSMRRKSAMRASKRSYGNLAFDDPSSITNPLNFPALAKFANNAEAIAAEFEEVPQVTAQTNELPEGCETKNRYANVIPLPETRVFLTPVEGYINSDYINANYVTGPKSTKNYYIACQAPMQNTVEDFWRMVWEQQSKVILMLTHLFENGGEKCVDYLPPSEVLDCHRLFGDFQITLKNREVKEKYVISVLQLKNMVSNSWREVTHLWYLGWPEKGVPSEANSLIAFLIEARSYIKALPSSENGKTSNGESLANGTLNLEYSPIVVHCSPGTGRTGTVIACDIAIREFELARQVDIPKTVYRIRRDRASSVQTKEQYEFIYNVITLYATKLTGGVLDSL
ncbi:hypothetical protein PPYR_06091 [Photinus pyralis]|uniref:protein-tyrosine-phosphatase n=1 Tax=Photinus pyralis TaxID=7054 RepID=A0A5N4ASP1_PHOPY|nr:flocculation protein FLO11-like [Photinus pyralis]XP_031337352.1 flocculation protein FLO11-like [Photinus pyralis]XP_031337353.1 flocculation protein FLO11-like [Photinus pyralis]XP_031337354.1 flocculation protein FLO11-like [Photinus pyralis]XP_031337356.1 flocculation protein FLO11-like [Photinus pyralis]KAB0800351.1 hypothetical protein PPYR_06091 [Photinus pyralis]